MRLIIYFSDDVMMIIQPLTIDWKAHWVFTLHMLANGAKEVVRSSAE